MSSISENVYTHAMVTASSMRLIPRSVYHRAGRGAKAHASSGPTGNCIEWWGPCLRERFWAGNWVSASAWSTGKAGRLASKCKRTHRIMPQSYHPLCSPSSGRRLLRRCLVFLLESDLLASATWLRRVLVVLLVLAQRHSSRIRTATQKLPSDFRASTELWHLFVCLPRLSLWSSAIYLGRSSFAYTQTMLPLKGLFWKIPFWFSHKSLQRFWRTSHKMSHYPHLFRS